MQLDLNALTSGRKISNFWNNVHFHPTDAVEDIWGSEILENLAQDRSAQYLRLYTMFEDIVTRDSTGKLCFDFSEQDRRFDIVVEKGFKVLLCFNFMPVVMAQDPVNLSGRRYKDKHFCRSNPADYKEWQELCRVQTAHLVERYGIETLKTWLFHCWNEPDLGFWMYPQFFFECTPEMKEAKITEYCKLYDHFEAGVHAAAPEIRVGGPSCGHYKEFFERVIKHVSLETNYVTGTPGTRFDFASLHCYSSIPQDVHDPYRFKVAPESIVAQYRTYRSIMGKYAMEETPVVIDEWAAAAEGYLGIKEDARMRFRETEYYSAFYFKLIDLMSREQFPPERMMICLSGQDYNTEDFDGHRTFFTARGWRKPICNGFALGAKLGEELIPVEAEMPKDTGVILTRRADGAVVAAFYNHVSDFGKFGSNVPLKVKINGVPEKFSLRRWRIDEVFSNAFTAWSRMGSPVQPTVWEREMISRRSRLEEIMPPEKGGTLWYGELLLTPNSVEVIEFVPENKR